MVKVVVEFRCLVKRLNDAEYQLTRLENWALKRSVVVAVKGEDGKITDYIFKDKPNPEDWEIDVPESR